jgi:hypothetical protein
VGWERRQEEMELSLKTQKGGFGFKKMIIIFRREKIE